MKSSRRSRLAPNGTSKRSKSTPMSPPKSRPHNQPQSESSPSQSSIPKPQQQQQQTQSATTVNNTTTTVAATSATTTSVTAAARYQKNLNSLRRVDPTILSIIDQFSHICLYRLHEGKWQKDGFEGASFLFERAAYPPYGLFILNRAGMHDYIHPIHPEDEIQAAEGEYLMYRSYPEFTAKRLAMAKSAPRTLTESWTDAHRRAPSANDPLTNWRYLLNQKPDKGPHETVMFWFLGSDSEQHEPLSDTIERLMTFIRKGESYPYNLDRPPPRAQHPPLTDANSQETGATSPVDVSPATLSDQQQGSESQPSTAPTNGATSDLDKLFSKLIPTPSPAPTPNNKVTLETLFASASTSASASSTPSSNLVTPPSTTAANKGLALLDTIFASATPPPGGSLPAPTPPPSHHVSSEPFPPPPSVPPSTRLAFASAHPHSDFSSSEPDPDSLEPSSPSRHAAAQLIHSPQPTNSQLPQILTQDVISALLGMPPSRTSSVASSQRRYEGDVESSDDLHEAESPIEERPLAHANRSRKHELGDVTPRPPLRGFASTEKVLPAAPTSLPSHHSAPSVLPTAAASLPSAPVPPSEPGASTIGLTVLAAPDVCAPRTGTSPAPRVLVPFHAESSLWPYPRAPLDDRDDIVELDFADTSALSDVDAFERRRQNGKNGAKMSKKDRAREREEIERSWDVPGKTVTFTNDTNVDPGLLHPGLGRPSSAVSPSPQPPQSGAVNANAKRPNSGSAPMNNSSPSSIGGQTPTAPPYGNNNKTKAAKSKSIPNGANNVQVSAPPTTTTQASGAAALVKSAVSTAIVEAVRNHNHLNANGNGNASGCASVPTVTTTDRNEFVRELLTLLRTDPSFVDLLWSEYRARA